MAGRALSRRRFAEGRRTRRWTKSALIRQNGNHAFASVAGRPNAGLWVEGSAFQSPAPFHQPALEGKRAVQANRAPRRRAGTPPLRLTWMPGSALQPDDPGGQVHGAAASARRSSLHGCLLACGLARTANRFRLLTRLSLGRLLVCFPGLHLTEDAFALHLLLQSSKGLINVVVPDENLQRMS